MYCVLLRSCACLVVLSDDGTANVCILLNCQMFGHSQVRDMEMKHTREKDRLEHEFNEEKRQLKKSLDRDLEARRDDMKRECENKYTKTINDLEREKARLLGRLERERGEVRLARSLMLRYSCLS